MNDSAASTSSNRIDSALDNYDPSFGQMLYRHTRREQWGLAIVLRKLPDRMKMIFQDGRTRSFKTGYYHLIDSVDRPLDVSMGIVEALESMAPKDDLRPMRKRVKPVSPDEQMTFFLTAYPEGFQGHPYEAQHRGDGRKRPLKRHRDGLIAAAAPLGKRKMAKAIEAGDYEAVMKAAKAVVNISDLVSPAERKLFAGIESKYYESVANYLHAMLHGRSEMTTRFDAFVRALEPAIGQCPSWNLSTIILGAVHPEKHVVVRPRVLGAQAEFMKPGLSISERPIGLLYGRLLAMAGDVKKRLEEAELEPRDMLDVLDFTWMTLRPAAKKEIIECRAELGLDGAAATNTNAASAAEKEAA